MQLLFGFGSCKDQDWRRLSLSLLSCLKMGVMRVIVLNLFCFLAMTSCSVTGKLFTDEQLMYLPAGTRYRTEAPPPAKQSPPLDPTDKAVNRNIYGGKGDKPHLGGFTAFDPMGISNNTFNFMMGGLAVKSLVDVGCGKGVSTKYFHDQGVKVLCVEGSHDAVTQSVLPPDRVVEHDFSLGPWWPKDTYDVAWSVEFIEHVGRHHMENYLPIFHKSALIFISGSGFGGWHHVEVHARWWWKSRLAAQGFDYSRDLSMEVRKFAIAGRNVSYDSQHIVHSMMVFINPAVASLPQHKHLFGGHGCYANKVDNTNGGQACVGADALPAEYEALLSCEVEKKVIWKCQKNPRAVKLT